MTENTDSLFERLGGETGVNTIIRDMYRRVFDDEALSPFFQHVDTGRLQRMQYQFMSSILDGPIDYTGAELNAIHKGRGITAQHFAKFFGHLADAMEAHNAAPRDIDLALGRLATFRDKITGDANVDG